MIDYELTKKLKDAGYKLPEHTDCDRESGGCCRCGDDDQELCIPTLSELIEACGECLSHIKRMPHNGSWFAVSHCGHENHEPGGNNIECQSPTPEEAVANLWLELNKHER